MLIWVLFWILLRWSFVHMWINLYDTRPSLDYSPLQFNCLQYSDFTDWKIVFTINYCLRPLDNQEEWWKEGQPADNYQRFTFQQLSDLNVTAEHLLQWSTSADLAEDYQHFLNHHDDQLASQEVFRCNSPWFGPRCQYSFNVWKNGDFFNIVQRLITTKLESQPLDNERYATCFMHLKCQYDGAPICLHWTQICDGRVDCIDGAEDELSCIDLEINECQEDEYRCHNGLCIHQSFVNDGSVECFDQSDVSLYRKPNDGSRYDVKLFIWKEHGCRPGEKNFVCGDGQCVRDFETCRSGRHQMVTTFISDQGTLTKQCWMLMVCLTKIMDQVDGIPCQSFIQSMHIHQSVDHCESLIRFPTKPVLLHHVYFLYHRNDLLIDSTVKVLIPAYICYDMYLCEHLHPTFYYQNLSCRTAAQMVLNSSASYHTWLSMVDELRPRFSGCMLFRQNASSSLYCCRNSSKCISRHRIVDGIVDCPYQDDEQAFELSCSIRNQHRFQCDGEKQCRSLLYPLDVCPPRRFRHLKDILFQEICNRIPQATPQIIDGSMHTDETECEQWPCNNIYTRCDHYWNCPNGEDEANCTSTSSVSRPKCPIGTLECVSLLNYTIICLPGKQVADGAMDCLGGADEQAVCRENIQEATYPGFLCYNETKCLIPAELCDGHRDCRLGDDEAFCKAASDICRHQINSLPTAVEESICRLAYGKRKYFSFDNLPIYPLSKNTTSHYSNMCPRILSSQNASIRNVSFVVNTPYAWYCHEGLAALARLSSDQYTPRCFCPPNFYGDRCQYQNQRVIITLKLFPVNKQGVQSFFISLINEDDHDQEHIHSYHQFSHVVENTCGRTFKFFLLYSIRPKNVSINYFIRIDAYEQTTMTYLASWRYPIPFGFLPVNSMAIVIRVPAKPLSSKSIRCRLKCVHGRCLKYLNNDEFYCQCDQGWSGKRCHWPIDCDNCAPDSLCLGSHENRSICMCPLNRFGRRCLLEYSCSTGLECLNGGKCVIVDPSRVAESYGCLCPKEYHGVYCQIRKSVLHLSFENIDTTSHAFVHIFYSKHNHQLEYGSASQKILAQKLPMFQKSATFYSEESLKIVFVQFENRRYLVVLEKTNEERNISTIINPQQECPYFKQLITTPLRDAPEIRRVKYYHQICRLHSQLMCFVDDNYFCLCTTERHANCLPMERDFRCPQDVHCQNGAQCLQEHPDCPSLTFCICDDCFFGDRCEFYAKGIGLTLDDILRYELRPKTSLTDQPISVQISAALAVLIFVVGLINGLLALITFRRKQSRRVGAGIYLYASSITSLITVTVFNIKFWFLIITHIRESISHSILQAGCIGIETTLKSCVYTDSWLNACVAIERAITTRKGVNFNRRRSKAMARWLVLILPFLVLASLVHELVYRRLYDDEEEGRVWCILQYSTRLNVYSTFILSFHTTAPFLANLLSAALIIIQSVRRKANIHHDKNFWKHVCEQVKEHRHLITSPIILAILSVPRVIISILAGCVKANRAPWLYLVGYFISFIPSVAIFFVFILPSPLYREEFYQATRIFYLIRRSNKPISKPHVRKWFFGFLK